MSEGSPRNLPGGAEFWTGFVTGAVVGGGLALLLTPQSGEDLRHLFRANWRRTTNAARDLAGDLHAPHDLPT